MVLWHPDTGVYVYVREALDISFAAAWSLNSLVFHAFTVARIRIPILKGCGDNFLSALLLLVVSSLKEYIITDGMKISGWTFRLHGKLHHSQCEIKLSMHKYIHN